MTATWKLMIGNIIALRNDAQSGDINLIHL
jgi:hypothetical protein